jgi:hypothetical protein
MGGFAEPGKFLVVQVHDFVCLLPVAVVLTNLCRPSRLACRNVDVPLNLTMSNRRRASAMPEQFLNWACEMKSPI